MAVPIPTLSPAKLSGAPYRLWVKFGEANVEATADRRKTPTETPSASPRARDPIRDGKERSKAIGVKRRIASSCDARPSQRKIRAAVRRTATLGTSNTSAVFREKTAGESASKPRSTISSNEIRNTLGFTVIQ